MGAITDDVVVDGFVGRRHEHDALEKALDTSATRVVAVWGVGGIGKSALAESFSNVARIRGHSVVRIDGRHVERTASSVLAALGAAAGTNDVTVKGVASRLRSLAEHVVVAIENYDRLRLADGFVRDHLGPALPKSVLLVLVGRDRPVMAWFTNPRWADKIVSIEIGALDEPSSLAYLRALGLEPDMARSVARSVNGHPLAMTMAAALITSGTNPAELSVAAGTAVEAIAQEYLATVPDPDTRRALEAASVVRRTTESLAQTLLPDNAPSDTIDRLRALPFVEIGSDGLIIHDVVREAIAARLATIAPDRYQQYRRAAWHQLRAEMATIPTTVLWRYTADLLHLLDAPELREAFFPTGLQPLVVEPARNEDADAIHNIIATHCATDEAARSRLGGTAPDTRSRSVVEKVETLSACPSLPAAKTSAPNSPAPTQSQQHGLKT